ncbi:SDR family oxidoreductase [Pseudorhodoferax sp. Leaf274]|uniref:SDR family oxidoreductase n=1 Tax=Pseudorhodoferax sp. Leaf274 TaxID=1736318 RepID=UPI000703AC28|nr:SDR family oxidoreductase [Pseudorhodoferax sp. Leaf274]KQP39740.1 short-chain dehydrogenase [Pseudorhodoferax sp. Leaf274]
MPTVLVIGASRGIGLEFVRQYREAGDRVIATARDDAGLARLKDLGATPLRVDVANPASVSGLAWQLDGEKIDTALYVAGAWVTADARTPPTREDFDRLMHTNVLGAMQAIPQVSPLVEAAPRGCFAFITSAMARIQGVDSSHAWIYRASKAALNMAVASAQHDYPKAILVALSPGWVQTDMGGAAAPLTVGQSVAGMRAALHALTPQHRGAFLDHDGRPFEGW